MRRAYTQSARLQIAREWSVHFHRRSAVGTTWENILKIKKWHHYFTLLAFSLGLRCPHHFHYHTIYLLHSYIHHCQQTFLLSLGWLGEKPHFLVFLLSVSLHLLSSIPAWWISFHFDISNLSSSSSSSLSFNQSNTHLWSPLSRAVSVGGVQVVKQGGKVQGKRLTNVRKHVTYSSLPPQDMGSGYRDSSFNETMERKMRRVVGMGGVGKNISAA